MNFQFLKEKLVGKEKGMTLTEILVSIVIIGIISSIAFLNYHNIEKDFALQISAYKLAQDIRRALEKTMGAEECASCGANKPEGYGIYFDKTNSITSYILFADINGNGTYQPSDVALETIALEKGITIKNLYSEDKAKTTVSVVFLPPIPSVLLKDPGDSDYIYVELRSTNNKIKKIHINKAGLIYVE